MGKQTFLYNMKNNWIGKYRFFPRDNGSLYLSVCRRYDLRPVFVEHLHCSVHYHNIVVVVPPLCCNSEINGNLFIRRRPFLFTFRAAAKTARAIILHQDYYFIPSSQPRARIPPILCLLLYETQEFQGGGVRRCCSSSRYASARRTNYNNIMTERPEVWFRKFTTMINYEVPGYSRFVFTWTWCPFNCTAQWICCTPPPRISTLCEHTVTPPWQRVRDDFGSSSSQPRPRD